VRERIRSKLRPPSLPFAEGEGSLREILVLSPPLSLEEGSGGEDTFRVVMTAVG